ncbi:MAG: CHASE2 domain-containing protein [Bacteroidota bacterium]|nr:CHASE2 domain-containing protein [Bacteroidota bacterium]
MDRKFWLDTIFGTAFIFVLMYFVLKTFNKFDILDPIGEAINDVEITDMVFSRMRKHPGAEEKIVIVNIGNLNREGIAEQLTILNKYKPKLVAIDVFFRNDGNPRHDSLLGKAFSEVENLILASKISNFNQASESFDSLETSHPKFNKYAKTAYANIITEAKDQDHFKTCRTFTPREYVKDANEVAFGVKICQIYAPEKAEAFLKRNNVYEVINYRGNILYEEGDFGNSFYALDVEDVLNENFDPEMIENKIVIMGYIGNHFDDKSWKDKFFTPMNLTYAGKTNPDMFGVVIHANIVSMILNGSYINEMGKWGNIMSGVFLCFLNVVFFSIIYRKLSLWYDGLTKIIQIIEVIILLGIIIGVFYFFNYKLNITIGIAAILLSGDSLEAYYGVIKNLFSKMGRKKVFKVYKIGERKENEFIEVQE